MMLSPWLWTIVFFTFSWLNGSIGNVPDSASLEEVFQQPEIIPYRMGQICQKLYDGNVFTVNRTVSAEVYSLSIDISHWCLCMTYSEKNYLACLEELCQVSLCDRITTKCVNLPLGYSCECLDGFTNIHQGICQVKTYSPIDLPNCDEYSTERVTRGGVVTCECREGFKRYSPFKCVEMKHCSATGFYCDSESTVCHDQFNGFECQCLTGYAKTNYLFSCHDIDECQSPHICPEKGAVCYNEPGQYACRYEGRYEIRSLAFVHDIDRCEIQEINPCRERLEQEKASQLYPLSIKEKDNCQLVGYNQYRCSCENGFEHDSFGFCSDIDECLKGTHKCQKNTQCVNTRGHYACSCLPGFRLITSEADRKFPEKIKCEDINECVEKVLTPEGTRVEACDPISSVCFNTPGSYECRCFRGYIDQVTEEKKKRGCSVSQCCVDRDECAEMIDLCSDVCLNGLAPPPLNYTCGCHEMRYFINDRQCENCLYNDYSELEPCNVTCGEGYRKKRRTVKLGFGDKSEECSQEKYLVSLSRCERPACYKGDTVCVLSPWSDWGPCERVDNKTIQVQSRRYIMGNASCQQTLTRVRQCEIQPVNQTLSWSWGEVAIVVCLTVFILSCLMFCLRGCLLRRHRLTTFD